MEEQILADMEQIGPRRANPGQYGADQAEESRSWLI
jgi:hypothetical protein